MTLEIGIFNLLNVLNEDWGQIKSVGGGVFYTDSPLTVRTTDGAGNLIWQFDPADVTDRFPTTSSTRNSYQVQVGVRYAF